MSAAARIAVFSMPEVGHARMLVPIVAGLARAGAEVTVFTSERFAPEFGAVGAVTRDLFAGRPLAGIDSESVPVPCRYVTFAAAHADAVAAELNEADLVLTESFALIGRLAAKAAGLPHVAAFCRGMDPSPIVEQLKSDDAVTISKACRDAVVRLRDTFGIADASPFSYVDGRSELLNLVAEPPEFVGEHDRRALKPVRFFGCIEPAPGDERRARAAAGDLAAPRVYASFGTIVWRRYRETAAAALAAVAEAVTGRGGELLVGLGGTALSQQELGLIKRKGVRIAEWAGQRQALAEHDIFVTHGGTNSVHEAVWAQTPMLTYPFLHDQPSLAERCRELGIAIPLTPEPRAPLDPERVDVALDELAERSEEVARSLSQARRFEEQVIARRDEVVGRVLELARGRTERAG